MPTVTSATRSVVAPSSSQPPASVVGQPAAPSPAPALGASGASSFEPATPNTFGQSFTEGPGASHGAATIDLSSGAPAPLRFKPFGAPTLQSDVTVPMVLKGLTPGKEYTVTMARPDAWSDSLAITRTVTVKADGKGEVLLGEADVRKLPGLSRRKLTAGEKAAASVVFAKLGTHQSLDELAATQPELAARLRSGGGANVVSVVAQAVDGSQKLGFEQGFVELPEGVTVTSSDPAADGYVGDTYLPPGNPSSWKQPYVIWGGSSGSINSARAKEIVAAGHPVLALQYFGAKADDPGVVAGVIPSELTQVPLEYFGRAIEKFLARPDIDERKGVSILGESRGAEGALLVGKYLGDTLPITDVVAMRPWTHVVGSKINGPSGRARPEVSSWTFGGKDIPYAPMPAGKTHFRWAAELSDGKTGLGWSGETLPIVDLTRVFRKLAEGAPKASRIDVDEMKPRLHLIGGSDDGLWDSGKAVNALGKQREGVHLVVKGGGHYNEPGRRSTAVADEIAFPVTPTPGNGSDDIGALMRDGGTPLLNAVSDVGYGMFMQRLLSKSRAAMPFPEVLDLR